MKENPNRAIQENTGEILSQNQGSSIDGNGNGKNTETKPSEEEEEVPHEIYFSDSISVTSDITLDIDDSLILGGETFPNKTGNENTLLTEVQDSEPVQPRTPERIPPSIKVNISKIVQSGMYYLGISWKEAAKTDNMILLSPSYSYKLSNNSREISCYPPRMTVAVPADCDFDYSRDLHTILLQSIERADAKLKASGETILNDDEVGFAIMAAVKFNNFKSSKRELIENTYSAIKGAESLNLTHDPEKFFEKGLLLSQSFKECAQEKGIYSGYNRTTSLDMTLGRIHPDFAQTFLAEKFETLIHQIDLISALDVPKQSLKNPIVRKLSKEPMLPIHATK